VGKLNKITALFAAFLLFQIEFIAAKKLLPGFGGGSSVWTTCMVFFQFSLLLGYGYALWLSSLNLNRQRWIHSALLLLGGISVASFRQYGGDALYGAVPVLSREVLPPVLGLLWVLSLSIGLPFFILSSTSSLLQSWWANRVSSDSVMESVNTFTLYSYSNAGSLLGLVSYPFLVEPNLSLSIQIVVWASAFSLYLLAFLLITLLHVAMPDLSKNSNMDVQDMQDKKEGALLCESSCLSMVKLFYCMGKWVGLAMIPSLMLLAITTHLTVNVAPIPLLWMFPLALYLISFMICFSGAWRQRDDLLSVVVRWLSLVALWPNL